MNAKPRRGTPTTAHRREVHRKRSKPGACLIADIPQGDRIAFVTDSQDVEPIKHSVGAHAQDFDAFFVQAMDGEYTAIWGIDGIFPALMKPAYRLR